MTLRPSKRPYKSRRHPRLQDPEVHIMNDKVEIIQSEEDPHGLVSNLLAD